MLYIIPWVNYSPSQPFVRGVTMLGGGVTTLGGGVTLFGGGVTLLGGGVTLLGGVVKHGGVTTVEAEMHPFNG